MKAETEKAIKSLMSKSAEAKTSNEAMQYAQSALNLAHVWATLEAAEKKKK